MRSTLKITSAMRLVATSKLRKAQQSIERLRPFEEAMSRILGAVESCPEGGEGAKAPEAAAGAGKTVILAFSGNASMCGAFNANAIRKAQEAGAAAGESVEYWAFGRKMADALRKAGTPAARDYSELVSEPAFDGTAAVAADLRESFFSGSVSRVLLVYNHFVNMGKQVPVCEQFLPFVTPEPCGDEVQLPYPDYYIYEPSVAELKSSLIPQVLDLKLYEALLDSAAAEHAARMVAMQNATDNGQELLDELTLEYNKGRQQKITSDILDLVSGASEI